jgi:hypothetical protein
VRGFEAFSPTAEGQKALWYGGVVLTDEKLSMNEAEITIEEVTDPGEIARFRAQDERHRRNADWLQAHWSDLLPQAHGKFLAVADQEAFIADSPEEAWALATAKHPEDNGAFVQYVFPKGGPRIYGHRG